MFLCFKRSNLKYIRTAVLGWLGWFDSQSLAGWSAGRSALPFSHVCYSWMHTQTHMTIARAVLVFNQTILNDMCARTREKTDSKWDYSWIYFLFFFYFLIFIFAYFYFIRINDLTSKIGRNSLSFGVILISRDQRRDPFQFTVRHECQKVNKQFEIDAHNEIYCNTIWENDKLFE